MHTVRTLFRAASGLYLWGIFMGIFGQFSQRFVVARFFLNPFCYPLPAQRGGGRRKGTVVEGKERIKEIDEPSQQITCSQADVRVMNIL